MIIEALVAILIFALGVLGLVGVNAMAGSTQSDARYRTDANRLANQIANEIWLYADRTSQQTFSDSIAAFAHRSDVGACDKTAGTPSQAAPVTAWVATVTGAGLQGLPGSVAGMQQILVDPAAGNRITVTLCWQAPGDVWVRKHVAVTYVN